MLSIRRWLVDVGDDAAIALKQRLTPSAERRLARGQFAAVGLILLCLAVYVPGALTLPVVDRDEARFAQASRQMFEAVALPATDRSPDLHDGGLVVPKLADAPRLNKPPLIYWLQAASAAAFTLGKPAADAIWMYRVPSLAAAMITVLATWRIGLRFFDSRVALLAAAMLAVCPLMAWEARQARADMVLVACSTLALAGIARVGRPRRKERDAPPLAASFGLWAAVAAGVLVKGPITPMIVALTVISIAIATRRWRWIASLRPVTGAIIVAAPVAAWVYFLSRDIDLKAYLDLALNETVGRTADSREGHAGPPGYHAVLLAVLFWPGVLATAAGLGLALRRAIGPQPMPSPGLIARLIRPITKPWTGRRGELFLLAWLVPSWLVFELTATKLPHYTLPLYPAVALLSARAICAAAAGSIDLAGSFPARAGLWIWVGVGFVIAAALPVLASLLGSPWYVMLLAAALAAVGAWLCLRARTALQNLRYLPAQRLGLIAAALALSATFTLALPTARRLWITEQLGSLIAPSLSIKADASPIAAASYHEDSLLFLTRGRAQRIDDPIGYATKARRGLLIAPDADITALGAEPNAPTYSVIGNVKGWNYTKGRAVNLTVIDLDAAP